MTDDGPGAPRARDSQATRMALLSAAQRRFSVLGYERTTTRDVAEAAGVNPALINRYFGGKDGLFEAVLAAAPELLAESAPLRGDLTDRFLDSLAPEAWPEFGQHPLLLFLRDGGADERILALRSQGMRAAVERIVEWSGVDAGEPGSARRRAVEIRAEMVLALHSGIVALRHMTPVEPLASAQTEELRAALQDVIAALLGRPAADEDRDSEAENG
jgi:AcrR family transcriptional regulator